MAASMQGRYRVDEEEIQRRITVPTYFKAVILPQMADYYSDKYVDFDSRPTACCPLHDEDTPSFRYYEETNTWFCFGCRQGGPTHGVVSLHRKFMERQTGRAVSKAEAIQFLNDFFIEQRGVNDNFVKQKKQTVVENTPAEMIAYGLNKKQLEVDVATCNNDLAKKIETWDKIDTVDMLVSIGEARAPEASDYLNKVVDKLYEEAVR